MEKVTATTLEHIGAFESEMKGVRRVDNLIDYSKNNPKLVAKTFLSYYSIIKGMVQMTDDDKMLIAKVNKILGKEDKTHKFHKIIEGRESEFISLVADACKPESEAYKLGLVELTDMMRKADEIKTKDPNARPVDGDPKWDGVIWGFTNGADDPIIDVHFVITHGLCRIMSHHFRDEIEDLSAVERKDWLLNAMTDIVVLNGLRGKGREAKIYQQWRAKRPAGLSWVSDARESAYKDALNQTS